MKHSGQIATTVKQVGIAALLLAMTACSPARVQSVQTYSGSTLPRPSVVVVSDFAVTPTDVKLDSGVGSRLKSLFSNSTEDEKQTETGRKVAAAVSKTLVKEIEKLGLPVIQADAASATAGNTLVVTGQLLSIDEGNRTRRNLIGLGAGRSSVQADTQLYYRSAGTRPQLVASYEADTESGRKPGAAETMGVGAATDAVGRMAVTSAGTSVASETLSADVDDSARRWRRRSRSISGSSSPTRAGSRSRNDVAAAAIAGAGSGGRLDEAVAADLGPGILGEPRENQAELPESNATKTKDGQKSVADRASVPCQNSVRWSSTAPVATPMLCESCCAVLLRLVARLIRSCATSAKDGV